MSLIEISHHVAHVAAIVVVGVFWAFLIFVVVRDCLEARRRVRGRERIVGPGGRTRVGASRRSLGPAFHLMSNHRQRGARRGPRR